MRLWHEDLIPILPKQQLLGQHRECCALRGKGWNRKHSTVDYVFTYSPTKLYQYHLMVMYEMIKRGYNPSRIWFNPLYRGKVMQEYVQMDDVVIVHPIYAEHDDYYLNECITNLKDKGVDIHL